MQIEYAEMMVEKRIPSVKKFAKVIKSKGIDYFGFRELDVDDIMDLLQEQGFFTDEVSEDAEKNYSEKEENSIKI